MENIKRSLQRLFTRLSILGLVVVCAAIAVAQANRQREGEPNGTPNLNQPANVATPASPPAEKPAGIQVSAEQVAWNQPKEISTDEASLMAQLQQPELDFRDDAVAPAAFEEDVVDSSPAPESGIVAPAAPPEFDSPPQATRFDSRFGQHAATANDPSNATVNTDDPPDFSPVEPTTPTNVSRFGDSPSAAPAHRDFENNISNATDGSRFNQYDSAYVATGAQVADGAEPNHEPPQFDAAPDFGNAPKFEDSPKFNETGTSSLPNPENRFGETGRLGDASVGNPVRERPLSAPVVPEVVETPTPEVSASTPPMFGEVATQTAPSNETTLLASQDEPAGVGRFNGLSGTGKPGPRELEGPQRPTLSIHKVAPKNVQVGQSTTFEIKVRNNGQSAAEQVFIRDAVPEGTQLVTTSPQAIQEPDGSLIWEIGRLDPNEESVVRLEVTPLAEGTIGSVASVISESRASAQVQVTQPRLQITHSTDEKVMVGETVRFTITVENPGSGPARDVVIEEIIPAELSHADGPKLAYNVGTIPANGRKRLELAVTAAKAGFVANTITARGDGDLVAEHTIDFQIVAPALKVELSGPEGRILESRATYTVAIKNPGTADTRKVEIVSQLPAGVKFVRANNNGRFNASDNTIRWNLDRLPAQQYGEVEFTVQPMRKGTFKVATSASASRGLSDSATKPLLVQGLAAPRIEVSDVDLIEVGGITTYEIRVENPGTEDDKNVSVIAEVPAGMRPVSPTGVAKYRVQGNQVIFNPIASLPAKGKMKFEVRVECMEPGDHRFRVAMRSDSLSAPVIEEESTTVYAD